MNIGHSGRLMGRERSFGGGERSSGPSGLTEWVRAVTL